MKLHATREPSYFVFVAGKFCSTICSFLILLGCDVNLQDQTTELIHEVPVQVTNDGWQKSNPTWSPDGSMIAYSVERFATTFRQVSIDGTKETTITTLEGVAALDPRFALSPDGTKATFRGSNDSRIWIADFRNGIQQPLTPGYQNASTPAWSPDGLRIAYSAHQSGETSSIWTIPATGGTPERITAAGMFAQLPSWSPDGLAIAFESMVVDTSGTRHVIRVISLSDGATRQLTADSTDSRGPAWSPDGTTIAFYAFVNDTTGIWTVPMNGGMAKKLTTNLRRAFNPVWSPDGSKIAFNINPSVVRIASPDGQHITDTEILARYPVWFPDSESFVVPKSFQSAHVQSIFLWLQSL